MTGVGRCVRCGQLVQGGRYSQVRAGVGRCQMWAGVSKCRQVTAFLPPPAIARTPTRSHTGSPPAARPPCQALPAGASAAAAPAMDVRLYPSAPAVGARPGSEPAGLAHLDYYHCGKVGARGRGLRVGPARAFGPRAWQVQGCSAEPAVSLGVSGYTCVCVCMSMCVCTRARRHTRPARPPTRRAHATRTCPLPAR